MAEYKRIAIDGRTPWDAVIVTVSRGAGRTVADVAAVDEIADFPMPVPEALEKAAILQERLGLTCIAVRLQEENLWRSEWGELIS